MELHTEAATFVQDVFDRVAVGDVPALSAAMSDDVRWVFPGTWSWSGTWSGREQVVHGLLRPLMTQFASYRLDGQVVLAEGDRVAVRAQATATTVTGQDYPQLYLLLITVRDRQIVEIVEHCDTGLVERVLEPMVPPAAA
ncbi:nuclear transport factor 2 family protein [Pseudonocardia sp. CA-107938]|uniref:nuclear transport factor 2 family protein n=1 Tax=Pseudonocardia sp. CA-107938 TaxID=3240021 RepID=UPI003D8AFC8E